MGHSIALNFEDGVTRFIECRPGETIADASYRLGIDIPLDCRDGVCGTCKCRVESGECDRGSYFEDALTGEEAAEGLALACQTRPKTDLVVAIAASSAACKTRGQTYRPRGRRVARGIHDQNPRLHLLYLRGGRRQHPFAQGLCHGSYRGWPPEWRRRGRLPVRPAAHGGRSPCLARRAERDAGEFLLRKVR